MDSQLNPANLSFIEQLFHTYQQDPQQLDPEWRKYFRTEFTKSGQSTDKTPRFSPRSIFDSAPANGSTTTHSDMATKQDRVDQLVRAYRVRGHLIAQVDPLGSTHTRVMPGLKMRHYGFTKEDLHKPFSSRTITGARKRTLAEILLLMRTTYCRSIGAQFMHIDDLNIRHWLQERMEGTQNRITLSRREQLRILTRLTDAVIFEEFIQKKYIGAKRFSLEGAESLIPLLDLAIESAGDQNIKEIVIGMAHRGRINVLANILDKHPRRIFREFADVDADQNFGRGDVKYHLGWHSNWTTTQGKSVHLALCFNPSHLEFVNAVVMGRMRAKQDRLGDWDRREGMCILIHGDAAFAGEGVVQETLNLSELDAYRTGGTLHIIVNNQIGFTTEPHQSRSSTYCTDVAKMLQSPILHVNGEDPEAVAQAITLAMDFRHQWQSDVVIDMYCYRRYGHNEGDEPAFTQPQMYRTIRSRKSVRDGYLDHLLKMGGVTRDEADAIAAELRDRLEQAIADVHEDPQEASSRPSILGRIWKQYRGGPDQDTPEVDTGVEREKLSALMSKLTEYPEGFNPHPKMKRLLDTRRAMASGEKSLDWAAGEALAFATLAVEGVPIRMSGQDSERGTFSHRHSVMHDVDTGKEHMPLNHLSDEQARVQIYNSPLSEAGVLGFEYGYSIAYPDGLVLWEAQFGDFANAAQVVIDQFLASAEDKWHSLSGIVLLLPHGFEGQGPEHSSARLERFLALCAEDNIQVVYPTTPAQYYHLLRRQIHRPWRKPLVVMTPKSLLRDPRATSTLEDCATGRFQRIIPDTTVDPQSARRIILCSGKVYYDLLTEREKRDESQIPLIRVEQLYPLSDQALIEVLGQYPDQTPLYWVQEEPRNNGAFRHLRGVYGDLWFGRWPLTGVSREASASPATGSPGSHKLEQQQLLDEAFAE
jgi:2-oxoglutarate dehydrogenase E1 component